MTLYGLDAAMTLAEYYYQAGVPFAFEGDHGIGKSMGLQSLANKLDVGFVDLRLSLYEETDLVGAPYRDDKNETSYTTPIWLKLIQQTGKIKGLLCLEELNRCDALVRQPALQLLWDRRCSHWKLPDGWLPVATWNPNNGEYETVELDPALKSRLVVIPVESSADAWLEWAKSQKLPLLLTEFIQEKPHLLNNSDFGTSPRSWHMCGQLLNKFPQNLDLLRPVVGNGLYQELIEFDEARRTLPSPGELFQMENLENFLESLTGSMLHLLGSRLQDYLIRQQKISESNLQVIQTYLLKISPDAAVAWLEGLKSKDYNYTRQLLKAFSRGYRNETIELVTHVFQVQ